MLLAAGADVAAQDDLDGKTPLHVANVDSDIQVFYEKRIGSQLSDNEVYYTA